MEELVRLVSEVDGVTAALVSGVDGLLVDGYGDADRLDELAASGTQVLTTVGRLGALDGLGSANEVTARWAGGSLLAWKFDADRNFIVLLERPGNAAYVRYLVETASTEAGASAW